MLQALLSVRQRRECVRAQQPWRHNVYINPLLCPLDRHLSTHRFQSRFGAAYRTVVIDCPARAFGGNGDDPRTDGHDRQKFKREIEESTDIHLPYSCEVALSELREGPVYAGRRIINK